MATVEYAMSSRELVTWEIMGLPEPTTAEAFEELAAIGVIRQGLPMTAAQRVAEFYGATDSELSMLLGTSERTLSRRKKETKLLELPQSDRLYRLARIAALTREVFESDETARRWMRRPNRALGGLTPFEMLDTDIGAQKVNEVLARIEYGVYS
jgi:putative toxin-antitoxin system antitoxin component (TIGR02293 family)